MLVIRSTKFIASSNFSVLIRAMRHGMKVTWWASASSVQVAYSTSKLSKYMWLLAFFSIPELEQKNIPPHFFFYLTSKYFEQKCNSPWIGVDETITKSHSDRGSSVETCSTNWKEIPSCNKLARHKPNVHNRVNMLVSKCLIFIHETLLRTLSEISIIKIGVYSGKATG